MVILSHRSRLLTSLLLVAVGAHAQIATRDIADPDRVAWHAGQWNSASGNVKASGDVPTGTGVTAKRSLEVSAHYSGKGFEFFGVEPDMPAVPGTIRRLSAWVKTQQSGYSWSVSFRDRDGNDKIGGKKLEWPLKAAAGEWTHIDFLIPANWAQPVRVAAISGHNWSRKNTQATATLRVCALQVETDVSTVTDRDSLVSLTVSSDAERNVFVGDAPVRLQLHADSWLGEELEATLTWEATDWTGVRVAGAQKVVAFREMHTEDVTLSQMRLGAYRLSATLTAGAGDSRRLETRFAKIATPLELTDAEKFASPWGLNTHGGVPGVAYGVLPKVGFTWVRDYAYSFDWIRKARGDDGKYGGWPWYPAMDKKLRDSGLVLLPCLLGAITSSVITDGNLTPADDWKRDLMQVFIDFPQYKAWELDNEYDLRHLRAESARGWSSYAEHHRVFAEGLKYLYPDVLRVEQGTAGVHPDRVRQFIRSGAFADIDVVNGHFYCGSSPPETSVENANVGVEDRPPELIFDTLREFAEAADADGRDRQAWVTEFGWDTLAVHIVSELEQAAYLQRGYLLGLQAGLDKMFWYWNRDTKETPDNFFDGCGVFGPKDGPKPAVAAMSALARLLKEPEPQGTFSLGPNTMGHVFRDRGRLVACAFKVEPHVPAASAEFAQGDLRDMFGNPLPSRKVELGTAPVWVVDIPATDPCVRQTAYDLKSRHLVRATAGDPFTIEVRIRNRRRTPLVCELRTEAPEGWQAELNDTERTVPPGETEIVPVRVRLDPAEKAVSRDVVVHISEGDVRKPLRTQFLIVQAAALDVAPLPASAGTHTTIATLTNNSLQPRSFVLTPSVPPGWSVEPGRVVLDGIPAGGTREQKFTVTWSLDAKVARTPEVVVATPDNVPIASAPFTPGALRISRMDEWTPDGDLDDWPAAARLPAWVTRGLGPSPDADVYLAYSDVGLHLACEVRNSEAKATAPRQFWTGDCIELFIDTANDKKERKQYSRTDHQFWFVPLAEENRVYVGRWKRNNEIPATMYDIPDIPSACRKTDKGYRFESLLPRSLIHGFDPAKGLRLGLNLNISIPGKTGNMEIYWRIPKPHGAPTTPHEWGTVLLD